MNLCRRFATARIAADSAKALTMATKTPKPGKVPGRYLKFQPAYPKVFKASGLHQRAPTDRPFSARRKSGTEVPQNGSSIFLLPSFYTREKI